MLLTSLLQQNQLATEGSKFDNHLMNNYSGRQLPESGTSSPTNVPHLDNTNLSNANNNMALMMGSSMRQGQKRPADEAGMGMGMNSMNMNSMGMMSMGMNMGGMDNNSLHSQLSNQFCSNQGGSMMNERPTKRHFTGTPTPMGGAVPEDKLGSPIHQGFPLRNNLMGASLLNQNQDAQAQRLADYQSSLLASSLANRHAELAQRQLLSRYFSPQLRLNSLATSLATPPSLGLGSLTGHQLPGTASSGAPAPAGLAALLSRPNQEPLQAMAARFQQNQQSPSMAPSDNFCLPTGSGHRSDRLQDAGLMGAGGSMSSSSAANFQGMQNHSMLPNVADMQSAVSAGLGNGNGATDDSASPIPLGIDEDPNWLSEFHVFVRKNLVELCWASSEDVALRNASNRVSSHQVGIRCRCCAHLNPSARAQRSSAFPSSIAQIYQSFTMMLRAHFSSCTEVPPALKEKFLALKSKTTQGATDSKQYWIYSARKLGMVDSDDGIVMTKATTNAARSIPPFGSNTQTGRGGEQSSNMPLVAPNDRQVASDFLYTLLLQASRVRLQANEQRGNKKSLQLGLPGFACRHCCQLGRMGQCRIFPARRRTLPTKVYDLYEHIMRCTACPQETKDLLEMLHDRENYQPKTPGRKEFLDMIWSRLVEQQHS